MYDIYGNITAVGTILFYALFLLVLFFIHTYSDRIFLPCRVISPPSQRRRYIERELTVVRPRF